MKSKEHCNYKLENTNENTDIQTKKIQISTESNNNDKVKNKLDKHFQLISKNKFIFLKYVSS